MLLLWGENGSQCREQGWLKATIYTPVMLYVDLLPFAVKKVAQTDFLKEIIETWLFEYNE